MCFPCHKSGTLPMCLQPALHTDFVCAYLKPMPVI